MILLARRKPGSHLAGYWEFPGGKIENGESPEQSLERELYEEFSIQTKTGNFLCESIFNYGSKKIRLIGYYSKYLGGKFILESHDKIHWVQLEDIEHYNLAPADLPLFETLKANGKGYSFR